jgi:hypothetical protein
MPVPMVIFQGRWALESSVPVRSPWVEPVPGFTFRSRWALESSVPVRSSRWATLCWCPFRHPLLLHFLTVDLSVMRRTLLPSFVGFLRLVGDAPCAPALLQPLGR